MWARVVEVMLAAWLGMSPFILGHSGDQYLLWIVDFSSASAVGVLALLSFWRPTKQAHLGIVAVALCLMIFVFLDAPSVHSPAHQNHLLVGLLLSMFAIIPNHASFPPSRWRMFAAQ